MPCFGLHALPHLLFHAAPTSCIHSASCTQKVLALLWWLPKSHTPRTESRTQSTDSPCMEQSHPPSLPGAQEERWRGAQAHQAVTGQCVPVSACDFHLQYRLFTCVAAQITAPASPSPLRWEREEWTQPLTAASVLCALTALAER